MTQEKLNKANGLKNQIKTLETILATIENDQLASSLAMLLNYMDDDTTKELASSFKIFAQRKLDDAKKEFEQL